MKTIGKVEEKVHKDLKVLSAQWGLTMSETIESLLKLRLKDTNQPK